VGTFHHGKGDLHGITVVVRTTTGRTWVGRCDTLDAAGAHLLDADLHESASGTEGADDWLRRAARLGVWPRHPHVLVPAAEVLDVRRLGDLR